MLSSLDQENLLSVGVSSPLRVVEAASPLRQRDLNNNCASPNHATNTTKHIDSLPSSPLPSSSTIHPLSSPSKRSPARSVATFASPLQFRKTPPPPQPLKRTSPPTKEQNQNITHITNQNNEGIEQDEAIVEVDDEILSQSFALCAAAQQLLAQSQQQQQQQQQQTAATADADSIIASDDSTVAVSLIDHADEKIADDLVVESISPAAVVTVATPCLEELPETYEPIEADKVEVASIESNVTFDDAHGDVGADEMEMDMSNDLTSDEKEDADGMIETCTNTNCLAVLDLCENLSLEVTELNTRYDNLQEEGARLYKQYEIKCAMLKATKTHNQNQQEYITQLSSEHESLRSEYRELFHAYQDLEVLYNNLSDQQQEDDLTPPAPTAAAAAPDATSPSTNARIVELEQEVVSWKQRFEDQQHNDAVDAEKRAAASSDAEKEMKERYENEIVKLEQQLLVQQSSCEELRTQLFQFHQDESRKMDEALLNKTSELSKQHEGVLKKVHEDFEEEKRKLKEEMIQLEMKLSSTTSNDTEILQLQEELKKMKEEHASEKETLLETHHQTLSKLETEKATFITELESTKILYETKESEFISIQEFSQVLQTRLDSMTLLFEATRYECEEEKLKFKQSEKRCEELKEEYECDLERVSLESCSKFENGQQCWKELEQTLKIEHGLKIDELTCDLQSKTFELEQLSNEFNSERQHHTSKISSFQQTVEELKMKLEVQIREHIVEIQRISNETELMLALAQDRETSLKEELKHLELKHSNEVQVLKDDLHQLTSSKIELQTKVQHLMNLTTSLEQQLSDAISQHAYDLKCGASLSEDLEKECKNLRTELETCQRKNVGNKKKCEDYRVQVIELQSQLSEANAWREEQELAMLEKEASSSTTTSSNNDTSKFHHLQQDLEQLSEDLMTTRRENATLTGRLQVLESLHQSEMVSLKSCLKIAKEEVEVLRRGGVGVNGGANVTAGNNANHLALLATKDTEITTLRTSLTNVQQHSKQLENELELIRSDKEQLLQQVELLMETSSSSSSTSGGVDNSDLASQLETLQSHNDQLKSYLTSYKAAGDAKMNALHAQHTKLISHSSQLCQTLVQQGFVKRDTNKEVFTLVQQIANFIKQQSRATQKA